MGCAALGCGGKTAHTMCMSVERPFLSCILSYHFLPTKFDFLDARRGLKLIVWQGNDIERYKSGGIESV